MRIEVDKQLAKLLAGIKAKEPTIYGRGHVETIRFLAHYYAVHKPLQGLVDTAQDAILGLVDNMDQHLEASLTRALPKVLAHTFSSIMALATDKTGTTPQESIPWKPDKSQIMRMDGKSLEDIEAEEKQQTKTSQRRDLGRAASSHLEDAEETPRAGLQERSTARRRRRATTQRQQDEEAITARRAEKEGEQP